MALARLPGRSYNKCLAEFASLLDSVASSFTTGKKACDTANDLTRLLGAKLEAPLPQRIYCPFEENYVVSPGRPIREKFISILKGIETCTTVGSHSTSLQVIFMLATSFPMFRFLLFTDEDMKERLFFDESKYYDLITGKFDRRDAGELTKLANVARKSLKEDIAADGLLNVLDPSMATVKMLQNASNYHEMLIALSFLKAWMFRTPVSASEPMLTAGPAINLVCELSRTLDRIFQKTKKLEREIVSKFIVSCVHQTFLRCSEEAKLSLEEVLKWISHAKCYELAWSLSKFLWEECQRLCSVEFNLIQWDTEGLEEGEACVDLLRRKYAQGIEAMDL